MFGEKNTAYKTARVRVPGHLAKTRRNLILLSSALTCAILVICLMGAWGVAAHTSRQGNVAAMSDVVANSLELTPQALQGGASTVDQALVQAQARYAASQDALAQGSASYAAAIKSEDRTSPGLVAAWRPFVLLELADGTVKFAIAPQWGEPQEVIMSRDDAVGLVQGAIDAVHGRASGAPASHEATQTATHTAQAGPTTWLWSTYVLCVNPRGMGNPGGDVVSFYEDDDLSAYADEGLIAARAFVFVDQTPSLTSLTSLAVALASVGAVGCVLLVLACRAVIGRALAPAAAAWEAQQRFVGRASHELKTPLASLTSALDVLDAHADQTVASQERWLFNMREDVDQMAGMACTLLGALDPGVDVDAEVGAGAGAGAGADANAGPGADPAGSATSSATSPVTNGEEL